MRALLRLAVPFVLVACSRPDGSAVTVTAKLDAPVVVEAKATDGEGPELSLIIRAKDAVAGDYLVFESETPPTTSSGLGTFDPTACGKCLVDGLGTLALTFHQDADGPLDKTAEILGGGQRRYYVIVRSGVAAGSPATDLTLVVIEDVNSGCLGQDWGTDPPEATASNLPPS